MFSAEPRAGTRATAPPARTASVARVAPQANHRRPRRGLTGGRGCGPWVGEPFADAGVRWTGVESGGAVGGV